MISEYTVAGVAAESPHGLELAREWMQPAKEHVATTGWATYSGILSLKDDSEVDSLSDNLPNQVVRKVEMTGSFSLLRITFYEPRFSFHLFPSKKIPRFQCDHF